jgi:hypothetical protein
MSVPFRWLRDPVTLGSGKLETLQVMRAAGAGPSVTPPPFPAEPPPPFAAEPPPFAVEPPPFAAEPSPFAAEPPPPFSAELPPLPGMAMEPLLLLPDFTLA